MLTVRFHAAAVGLAAALLMVACAGPEDPSRVSLRERLKQSATLSTDELAGLRAEVSKTIGDNTVSIRDGSGTRELGDRRALVLGMLTDPVGLFDEGLRIQDGETFRVLNAPAESTTMEIEAARRLYIDVETFEPRRFEFAHAFPNPADYSFELVVD